MPNRLASETSPYLLQHKDNPIDWFPWGDEAFQKAADEQKPVFLSVGYSSCHWCHVMAHESFESHEVAKLLNEHFVSIKVDREERPDVDETYMAAVHLGNGRGGWPMTVFLTPDKRPFFAGTYFSKHDRGQTPGLISILRQVAEGWKTKREDFDNVAERYDEALRGLLARGVPESDGGISNTTLVDAVNALANEADLENGGFGTRPKFPPHTAIEFLMAFAESGIDDDAEPESRRAVALTLALHTLDAMAMGGIHDHVGGGFHRYSTDERWLLPHFEKMLSDNVLLLPNYVRAADLVEGGDPQFAAFARKAAHEIVDWVDLEMTSPEGLFYSAIDADSEGEEGRFYVWNEAEVRELLGESADAFLSAYRFEPNGNFADEATGRQTGANIPHLTDQPEKSLDRELAVLRQAREARVRPQTDTKALVGLNGLAIAGLSAVGEIDKASKAAVALLGAVRKAGEIPRQVTAGEPAGTGFLEDYAYLAFGLLRLGERTGESRWAVEAERIVDEMIRRFWDGADAGFFATGPGHEQLFGRTKPVFDQPVPSANSIAIRCLIRLGRLGEAKRALDAFAGWMVNAPQSCEGLVLAALEYLAVAGEAEPSAPKAARNVSASLAERQLTADSDGWAAGVVQLEIPDGMHVNPYEPVAKWLVRTEVQVQPLGAKITYPESTETGYVGLTQIPFRVRLPEGKSVADIQVAVRYQACTETECLAPVEQVLSAQVKAP